MDFFIYSRKSVTTGRGESIENQIEMCRSYIQEKFCDSSERNITIYEDEGFSAKNTARPQFQQMINDIKKNKPDYLVCYRLDRISRSVSDFSSLIEYLNRCDIAFLCIREEFDTAKPMGKAMMYIASVFAQLERETIAERVRDNMMLLARTGRWLGGTPPTGYRSEKVQAMIIDGKAKTACKLNTEPKELETVELIFMKFLELGSVSGVSRYLIKNNVHSRTGTFYSLPGLKQILQNPVYCIAEKAAYDYFVKNDADLCFEASDCSGEFGLLAYNKRDYRKKNAPRQAMNKWIIAIGKHPGLISGTDWVSVQRILETNTPVNEKKSRTHNDYALLSGLIYCEACDRPMFAKPRTGKKQTGQLFDYVCSNKLRSGNALCSCQNVNGPQADQLLWVSLIPYMAEGSHIYKLLERLKKQFQSRLAPHPSAAIQTAIQKCQDEISHFIALLSQGGLDTALIYHINDRVKQLDQDLKSLEEKQQQLQQELFPDAEALSAVDETAVRLSTLSGFASDLSIDEQRILINLLVQKIVWNEKELHVFLREPDHSTLRNI